MVSGYLQSLTKKITFTSRYLHITSRAPKSEVTARCFAPAAATSLFRSTHLTEAERTAQDQIKDLQVLLQTGTQCRKLLLGGHIRA